MAADTAALQSGVQRCASCDVFILRRYYPVTRLQLAGQSETHPTADNHVSMSRTEQTAVSPAEQKPDGEFEYNFYQML